MPRTKSYPVQRRRNKRAADDMISADQENMSSTGSQHNSTDFRLPLPKKRMTEVGDVATSGSNNEIEFDNYDIEVDNDDIEADSDESGLDNDDIEVDNDDIEADSDDSEADSDESGLDNDDIEVANDDTEADSDDSEADSDESGLDNDDIEVDNDDIEVDNDEIGVGFIAKPRHNLALATPAAQKAVDELNGTRPRRTNTIMTPAAKKAVEELPLGKPDSQFARARLLSCKAEEDATLEALTSATQMLREVIEWSGSLHSDVSEAELYSNEKFQLAKALGTVAAEKTKTAAEATEKVVSLQQQVVDLREKAAFAETVRKDHDSALDELDASYDEDDRVCRCLKFNLRVSSKILERTHNEAADHVRETGGFDARALWFLRQHLDEKTSSTQLLSPDIKALLSPEDVDRAVAAGRSKAEALYRSLEHGLQKIAEDLFGPSDGIAALADTSMPELARHLAEDSVSVVEQVARIEALRLVQEAKAANMKAGYSMVGRLRAEHEGAMSNLSECLANLAAATKEMEAAKEAEAEANERSKGAWEQHEAALLNFEDLQPQRDEAAAALELVGFDVLKKQKAWTKAFEDREKASTDLEKSIRRTSVYPHYLY